MFFKLGWHVWPNVCLFNLQDFVNFYFWILSIQNISGKVIPESIESFGKALMSDVLLIVEEVLWMTIAINLLQLDSGVLQDFINILMKFIRPHIENAIL